MKIIKKIWYIIAAVGGFILFNILRSKQAQEKAEISMSATTNTTEQINQDIEGLEEEKQKVLAEPIKLPQDDDPEDYWDKVMEDENKKKQ